MLKLSCLKVRKVKNKYLFLKLIKKMFTFVEMYFRTDQYKSKVKYFFLIQKY